MVPPGFFDGECMEQERAADRKSRVVHFAANDRGPVWRSVGSVTILAPELDAPLHLRGAGYTVFLQEARDEGDLRDALIYLRRLGRPAWQAFLYWSLLGAVFGFAIARAYYTLMLR
jgi:hypothetical protein